MRRAMERHEAGEARVIPVILRPCDWHTTLFGKLQALPNEGKAVTKWQNRDEAFTDVARGIREAVSDLSKGASSSRSGATARLLPVANETVDGSARSHGDEDRSDPAAHLLKG